MLHDTAVIEVILRRAADELVTLSGALNKLADSLQHIRLNDSQDRPTEPPPTSKRLPND